MRITNEELEKLKLEQIELNKKIVFDDINYNIRYVCAVDVSYWTDKTIEYCACVALIYDIHKKKVIERASLHKEVTFPYISGFLTYREGEVELETIKKLTHKFDILLVDGNGLLHQRGAGEAVYLGVKLDVITIGVAKSYYKMDGVEYKEPGNIRGSNTDIVVDNKVVGKALRSKENSRLIFVSVGNKIWLNDAMNLVLKLTNKDDNIPLMLRLVDNETHKLREKYRK